MELNLQTRKILGKDVKNLRKAGILPLHLFGHGTESLALQAKTAEIQKALSGAGSTGLMGITMDGNKMPFSVVVREVQREPMTGKLVHVDLYQVSMTEKIKMVVAIRLVGEALALKSKDNQLDQELDNLEIECLPAQIPSRIDLDISSLTESGKELQVKDFKAMPGIEILNDPQQLVVRIVQRAVVKEEEKPEAAAEKPETPEAAPGAAAKKE
jgi:large subunit ribosomal protein L25